MSSTLSLSSAYARDARHLAPDSQKTSPGQLVDSADLLQGQKAVQIQHNGAVYRLQATKLGKLILTK